jgi:hypothetical protein
MRIAERQVGEQRIEELRSQREDIEIAVFEEFGVGSPVVEGLGRSHVWD